MATILNIVTRNEAGTALNTIELNASGNTLLSYPLLSPEQRSIETQSLLRDGSNIGKTVFSDITEPVTVLAVRATDADLVVLRQSIETAFLVAARRQERKRGSRVFVEFQLDRLATMFRSEIKRGRLISDAADLDAGWRSRAMQLELVWLRDYYWESTTLTQLPLKSQATAKTTSPVTLANTDDAAYGNWVEILGTDLPGVLPLPIKLQLTNNYGSGAPLTIYTGLNIDADPTNLVQCLEAEDATWVGTVSTPTGATYSNGEAKQVTWVSSSDVQVADWTLTDTELQQFNGAWCQLIGRFPVAPEDIYLRFELRYNQRVIASTEPVLGTDEIHQRLGAMQIPPRLIGASYPPLVLRLYARTAGGGTFTMDTLHLLVSDGYVEYRGFGVNGFNGNLIDNPHDNTLYPIHFIKEPADGLMLRPNATQRITFIQAGNSSDQIARTMTVQAWYRERRLTL